jgi:fatty acid desaturase
METRLVRPALPKAFYEPSVVRSASFIAFAVAMFAIPASIMRILIDQPAPVAVKIVAITVLTLFAQQGLHLLGWVGHEGFHLSLARSKYVSALLGLFFSSAVVGFLQIGASISHWNHHRYTNQELDPDCEIFTRFRSALPRILFGRIAANRRYLRNVSMMAFGRPLPYAYKLPFQPGVVAILAWLNVAFSIGWLSLYAWIAVHDWKTACVCIALPMLTSIPYTGIRSYVEHAGTDVGMFVDTRTRTAPFFTFYYFGNNYHLEHHLYPSVPCYRLPAVHTLLVKQGYFDNARVHVEKTIWGAYRHVLGSSPYPLGTSGPEEFNPLVVSGEGT